MASHLESVGPWWGYKYMPNQKHPWRRNSKEWKFLWNLMLGEGKDKTLQQDCAPQDFHSFSHGLVNTCTFSGFCLVFSITTEQCHGGGRGGLDLSSLMWPKCKGSHFLFLFSVYTNFFRRKGSWCAKFMKLNCPSQNYSLPGCKRNESKRKRQGPHSISS